MALIASRHQWLVAAARRPRCVVQPDDYPAWHCTIPYTWKFLIGISSRNGGFFHSHLLLPPLEILNARQMVPLMHRFNVIQNQLGSWLGKGRTEDEDETLAESTQNIQVNHLGSWLERNQERSGKPQEQTTQNWLSGFSFAGTTQIWMTKVNEDTYIYI